MNQELAATQAGRVIMHMVGKTRMTAMDMACDLRINQTTVYLTLQALECIGAVKGEIVYAERQSGKPPVLWTLADWAAERVR
jgi:predicted ArsR family transcriptional regulator